MRIGALLLAAVGMASAVDAYWMGDIPRKKRLLQAKGIADM